MIDKVTLQILANHCAAAAESMAYTLMRTAHSTFVKETEDFSTGLAGPDGKTFASPRSLGATWFVGLDYGPAIAMVDDYEENDICITNDPYSGFLCTHSPDVHLWKPIFWRGSLVCFAVGHIHNTDVGGAVPATLSRTLTEVHQEGLRLPPLKLMKAGQFDDSVLKIMMTNVRAPSQNWGDLKAQIAAMNTGERKVHEMIGRFGIDVFRAGIGALMEYASQQARNVVREIPEGEYFFADYIDEDSHGGYPCRLALNLTVRDGALTLDFSGSDPQLSSSLNMPTGGRDRHILAMVGVVYVLYALNKDILLNSGLLEVARAILPEGSIVNPKFPAAVGMRSLTCHRIQTLTFGAFSLALPDRLPACPSDGGSIVNVRTEDRAGRSIMASIDPISGGAGGSHLGDGADGSGANTSFLKNTPVEINEAEVPIKIIRYALARDTAGAGRYRGGAGTVLEFQVFSPNTVVTTRNRDRSRFASWGIRGGGAGKLSSSLLNPGTSCQLDLGNSDLIPLEPLDILRISSCGAGGYGDPFERPAEEVLRDVRFRVISEQAASDEYGVAIAGGKIDRESTAQLRERPRHRSNEHFDVGVERRKFELVWTLERYAALHQILAKLPPNWRFFAKQKIFARVSRLNEIEQQVGAEIIFESFEEIARDFPQMISPTV